MTYPVIQPYAEGRLKVSSVHTLNYTQSGNPGGKPVLFLHGGPGAQSSPSDSVYFNPQRYRIIMFDQRGAGKSTPTASLEENTTWHLVDDIERLRELLLVDKWLLFGGSWGSTLAMAYAQAHPDRCTGMILRGFSPVKKDALRLQRQAAARNLFPDAWHDIESLIPEAERHDLLKAYTTRLQSEDSAVQLEAARSWNRWGTAISSLTTKPSAFDRLSDDDWCLSHARLDVHYASNMAWIEDGQLLRKEEIDKIRHLPCIIVQGRYDVICPPVNAWDLKQAWPESELHFVPDAGHSAKEPGTLKMLVEAADRLSTVV